MKIIYGITFLVLPLFVAGQLDGSGQGYGGSGQGKDPSGILGPDYEGSEEAYVSFKFTSRFAIVTMSTLMQLGQQQKAKLFLMLGEIVVEGPARIATVP